MFMLGFFVGFIAATVIWVLVALFSPPPIG